MPDEIEEKDPDPEFLHQIKIELAARAVQRLLHETEIGFYTAQDVVLSVLEVFRIEPGS